MQDICMGVFSLMFKIGWLILSCLVFSQQVFATAPFADKKVINVESIQNTKLNTANVIGKSASGALITEAMHLSCENKLHLSPKGIQSFKESLTRRLWFNAEPTGKLSTEKHMRYFMCIETYNDI
jgi:hypothetical protein